MSENALIGRPTQEPSKLLVTAPAGMSRCALFALAGVTNPLYLVGDKPLIYKGFWRKGWDSNPRGPLRALAVFKTAALNHSATLPGDRTQAISAGS